MPLIGPKLLGQKLLLLLALDQPAAMAALLGPRATPKLSLSSTGMDARMATSKGWPVLMDTRLQLRPGTTPSWTPWVDDNIYQAKLQPQARKAEASGEDTYALIVAISLAMECVGPLALAVALAVVGSFTLAEGELSFATFLASSTIPELVGGAWVASEATFYICCVATAAFFTAAPGHAPGARGGETETGHLDC